MGVTNWLGKIRAWVDGDEFSETPEEGKKRGPSKWEEYLIAVARGIAEVMDEETLTPPGGVTYVPPEYIVFMSQEDDGEWQGVKRQALLQGLNTAIAERVRDMQQSGVKFNTASMSIELRVDGNLAKGRFRVQPVWEVDEHTKVLARMPASKPVSAPLPPTVPAVASSVPSASPAAAATVDAEEATRVVARRPPAPEVEDEATRVRPRAPLFSVRVERDGNAVKTHPVHKSSVTVGRGAQADLRVEGDMEVSRVHLRLDRAADGGFSVTCLGLNSIFVGEKEVLTDATAPVGAGETVRLCGFLLCIEGGDVPTSTAA
jgi:hypothetical protein